MYSCEKDKYCKDEKVGISIIYAYENSDIFYPAKLLKHGKKCLCFAAEEPIKLDEKIYIMTQDSPLEGTNIKIYEGCFAQVEGCKKINYKNNPAYLIRGGLVSSKAISMASNELNVEIL
jgi:hypothetical protein